MHTVSDRFTAALKGPHKVAVRATLVEQVPQFGPNPIGVPLPVVDGNVSIQSLSDIKSTLTLTIPGIGPHGAEYWPTVQPFGAEIYIERGIEFAPGDTEYVGLGYHRIEQASQDNAPYGPIVLTCLDRNAQLQQNKLVFPLPLNNGDSHRAVFERLVNGIAIPQQATYPGLSPDGYGMYLDGRVPIYWTGAYDPDATTIIGDQIVQDDAFSYLSQLIRFYYAGIRFRTTGEMEVYSLKFDFSHAVATLHAGAGGQIISTKRSVKRTDVHNVVTAYGSDPSSITDFIVTFNADSNSPLAWNKKTFPKFGPAPTYYSSPLLQTDGDVELAGEVLLRRYIALPISHTLSVVPNPALECNDPLDVVIRPGFAPQRCMLDTITIPLIANVPGTIVTRIPTATEGLSLGLGIL